MRLECLSGAPYMLAFNLPLLGSIGWLLYQGYKLSPTTSIRHSPYAIPLDAQRPSQPHALLLSLCCCNLI